MLRCMTQEHIDLAEVQPLGLHAEVHSSGDHKLSRDAILRRLAKAWRKLSRMRQRCRNVAAWVPGLFLMLPRMRQRRRAFEA
ncbi:hypothetical protein BHE74_00015309 [Ensete ventricosum]|nr:hypothetical protein BHE74_00015309 [Ensete ventricosum]